MIKKGRMREGRRGRKVRRGGGTELKEDRREAAGEKRSNIERKQERKRGR